MTNTAAALYTFFSSFGWPAYAENSIPDSAELPYITYSPVQPDWRDEAILQARLWDRSTTYADVNAKADQIAKRIGEGLRVPARGGFIWINKGAPFAQTMSTSADIKVLYLNMTLQSLT